MAQLTAFNIALESGSDYASTDMSQVFYIGEYAAAKRMGLPTMNSGIRVHEDGYWGDWIWTEEEILEYVKENDLHPNWMENDGG